MSRRTSLSSAEFLPADLDYIPEELKLQAKVELQEDENIRIQSLNALRSMLKKEEGLRCQEDDVFLLAFLRVRKYDVKKAFCLIKGLYNCFGKHRHLYYDFTFDFLDRVMKQNCTTFLPHRDKGGCIVSCFRFIAWNPQEVTPEEQLVSATLGLLQALHSPATQIAGLRLILDFDGCSAKHILSISPSAIKFLSDVLQNTVPMRFRSIHVVNQNYLFSSLWQIVKQFLSQKIRDRVHFHGKDLKGLHSIIHPSILPADLGGEMAPFNNDDWRERMKASSDYIRHVLTFGYEKYMKKDYRRKSLI